MTQRSQDVAQNVNVLMATRGLKAAELIRRLGWSRPSFYNRMSGTTQWTLRDLDQLAEVLAVNIFDLLRDPSELVNLTSECSDGSAGQLALIA